MLVYDITNEKSFENIKNWIRNIEEVFLADLFMCLLVLKISKSYHVVHCFISLHVSSLDPARITGC